MRLLTGGMFSVAALLRMLMRGRSDMVLIVTNPPSNAFAAALFARLTGTPYVYLVHDLYPDIAVALGYFDKRSLIVRLFAFFQKRWLNAASRVVVLGRCMQEHLRDHYDVSSEKTEVISSWADPRVIKASPRENDFRAAHGLAGFVVLYAGNFSHYVNFDQIIEAAHHLSGNTSVSFVLIGDGVRKKELHAKIETGRLRNVRILPKVSRSAMNDVLAAADVSLISLEPRMLGLGVPSKLYTTLAASRPVIAMVPSRSEVARILEEEKCGANIADGDSLGLAEAISRLQADPGLAAQMGQRARQALENRFTLQHAAERFYQVFRNVAAARKS
jgi:glycosyltransferase involved in cell wall biosynthesis